MGYPDSILHKVMKPAQYTGGEWNSVVKDWDKAAVRMVIAYPDTYEIGMSNLAVPILYDIINGQPDVLAERVCAPWVDMEKLMRETGIQGPVTGRSGFSGAAHLLENSSTHVLNPASLTSLSKSACAV